VRRPGGRILLGRPAVVEGHARSGLGGEDGQALVLLVGLVVLVLMVLALGWDTSNWFLGHRALVNLADGAAVAAASDVDTGAWYASGGREVRLAEGRARATVGGYLAEAAGDSGVAGVRVASVVVAGGAGGPRVTVALAAPPAVAFLRWLRLVPPAMRGEATATARLVPP
jgi:Putative Flp pilus-assembly TadE/G-like